MWGLPGPGLEPVSPALAGRFLPTAPPGKSREEGFGNVCEGRTDQSLGFFLKACVSRGLSHFCSTGVCPAWVTLRWASHPARAFHVLPPTMLKPLPDPTMLLESICSCTYFPHKNGSSWRVQALDLTHLYPNITQHRARHRTAGDIY